MVWMFCNSLQLVNGTSAQNDSLTCSVNYPLKINKCKSIGDSFILRSSSINVILSLIDSTWTPMVFQILNTWSVLFWVDVNTVSRNHWLHCRKPDVNWKCKGFQSILNLFHRTKFSREKFDFGISKWPNKFEFSIFSPFAACTPLTWFSRFCSGDFYCGHFCQLPDWNRMSAISSLNPKDFWNNHKAKEMLKTITKNHSSN